MRNYNNYCLNCGEYGHYMKKCKEPITSYGIILVNISNSNIYNKIKNKFSNGTESVDNRNESNNINKKNKINKMIDINDNYQGISIDKEKDIKKFCQYKNCMKFLMVRRKNSLGYLDFIRGKYNVDNLDNINGIDTINFLFKQMVPNEIENIKKYSFEHLWKELWIDNFSITRNKKHNKEYNDSKKKFYKLKYSKSNINLDFFINNVKPIWNYPEWGFPKGKRSNFESNYDCALREFCEETNIPLSSINILNNICPIEETLVGTNGRSYKHVYYIAISNFDNNFTPFIDKNSISQYQEIGDIDWFTYDECYNIIRSYHIEKRQVIANIHLFILNTILNYS